MRLTMLNAEEIGSSELNHQQVHVEIIEQPASKSLRFRYEVEGRATGSILGANSTFENKTYPAIQVFTLHLIHILSLSNFTALVIYTVCAVTR